MLLLFYCHKNSDMCIVYTKGVDNMIKDLYYIKQIDNKTAQEVHIKEHYLHRKASCSYAYGLFDKATNEIVGVVLYGVPASRALQKGICGEEYADLVGELTRLWIKDGTPKNVESFLIGNTIKMQGFKILVSYAECRQGHVGYVYQATNWLYTGLSDKHSVWYIDGEESSKHGRHLFDQLGGINKAKEVLGDRMVKGYRPRKHRYIYFNCNKKEKKELMKKLRYKVQPYPKDCKED